MEKAFNELLNEKNDKLFEASRTASRKLKVIKILGEGSFGIASAAEYYGDKITKKMMKVCWAIIVGLSVMLKTNESNLFNTKLPGIDWPKKGEATITVRMESCDIFLRSILLLSHTAVRMTVNIINGTGQVQV